MAETDLLSALTEAWKILGEAKSACASLASNLPWSRVSHAREYIAKQADELLTPIFMEEIR